MQCLSCKNIFSQKTLDKYRGIYCKPCFFIVLKSENDELKSENNILKLKNDELKSENDNYRIKNCQLIYKTTKIIDLEHRNNIILKILNQNHIYINYPYQSQDRDELIQIKVYLSTGILIYDGIFIMNERTRGKLYVNDKLSFDGFWKDDKPHQGSLYKDNEIIYKGFFENLLLDGPGLIYKEGKLYYKGNFIKNKKNGQGKEYYNDGDIMYEGSFKDNKSEGHGIYYNKNGDIYEGEWVNDKPNGEGILKNKYGKIIKVGIWKDGNYIEPVIESNLCLICYTEEKTHAFIPCGHLCMCEECNKKYNDDKCIICRQEYSIPYKIYNN